MEKELQAYISQFVNEMENKIKNYFFGFSNAQRSHVIHGSECGSDHYMTPASVWKWSLDGFTG